MWKVNQAQMANWNPELQQPIKNPAEARNPSFTRDPEFEGSLGNPARTCLKMKSKGLGCTCGHRAANKTKENPFQQKPMLKKLGQLNSSFWSRTGQQLRASVSLSVRYR